ncbi:hypothetical protein HZB02_05190 [Candidatus Woesearchaeota archaeon]|nr:hypothetical protein [Candidatus Woesearchaeota archaeon]
MEPENRSVVIPAGLLVFGIAFYGLFQSHDYGTEVAGRKSHIQGAHVQQMYGTLSPHTTDPRYLSFKIGLPNGESTFINGHYNSLPPWVVDGKPYNFDLQESYSGAQIIRDVKPSGLEGKVETPNTLP